VEVRIARGVDRLLLSVRDDGRGFAPAALDEAAARGHLGVVGMRERVRARGGQFRLVSAPGAGATVEAELPTPRG
jgi:signal transduction histidine kinase